MPVTLTNPKRRSKAFGLGLLFIIALTILVTSGQMVWNLRVADMAVVVCIAAGIALVVYVSVSSNSSISRRTPTLLLLLLFSWIGPSLVSIATPFFADSAAIGILASRPAIPVLIVAIVAFPIQVLTAVVVSARIAQTAARFFLDSLPGRQMVIEANEMSGRIPAEVAKDHKRSLQLECDLYGAIDGVSRITAVLVKVWSAILLMLLVFAIVSRIIPQLQAFTISIPLLVVRGSISTLPAFLISINAWIISERSISPNRIDTAT